eukprot:Hpha_TRINITY_DN30780_c0_g1::TRINITY_DN30780_c0_g1_i1::g.28366::m.28366
MGKKKGGGGSAPAPAEAPAAGASEPWTCESCENENPPDAQLCEACDEPRPEVAAAPEEEGRYAGYKVGLVVSAEGIDGKDKLQTLEVDVGGAEPLAIVTNAPNVSEGSRVVVATVGAVIEDKGEEVKVKKAVVGGKPSMGMLCNGPMLGWSGGDDRCAALVPDRFKPGDTPPERRPRMDGK